MAMNLSHVVKRHKSYVSHLRFVLFIALYPWSSVIQISRCSQIVFALTNKWFEVFLWNVWVLLVTKWFTIQLSQEILRNPQDILFVKYSNCSCGSLSFIKGKPTLVLVVWAWSIIKIYKYRYWVHCVIVTGSFPSFHDVERFQSGFESPVEIYQRWGQHFNHFNSQQVFLRFHEHRTACGPL